jgi:hypothetical protein
VFTSVCYVAVTRVFADRWQTGSCMLNSCASIKTIIYVNQMKNFRWSFKKLVQIWGKILWFSHNIYEKSTP